MNNNSVVEGNKLIAEFMLVKVPARHYLEMNPHLQYYGERIDGYGTVDGLVSENELKYNTSWDALMPVVEKIAKMELTYENVAEKYRPYPRTFAMLDDEGNMMVRLNCAPLFAAPTLIEATWLAVVNFIELNNQTPQP
jgi:hypothetical protein